MFPLDGKLAEGDPLRYELALPFVVRHYPMGYAVEIATNSESIVTAAAQLWSGYPRLSEAAPVRLRVAVADDGAEAPAGAPVTRGQGHLISIVQSRDNFAVCDLHAGFSYAWLSAAGPRAMRNFVETAAYSMLAARHFALVHASCVALNGRAILLCGNSGAGKTCLAYALARRGWTYLSGDTVQLPRENPETRAIGRPFSIRFRDTAARLFPELAGHKVQVGAGGKVDVELNTAELNIAIGLEAGLDRLVFLDRCASAEAPSLSGVSRAETIEYLEQMLFYGDGDLRAKQRAVLSRLLALPAQRLRFGSFEQAESVLRAAVAESC